MFIELIFKDSNEVKKLCIKMQPISEFLDIANFADFQLKNPDVSRTQEVYPAIHNFFGSSLGKV